MLIANMQWQLAVNGTGTTEDVRGLNRGRIEARIYQIKCLEITEKKYKKQETLETIKGMINYETDRRRHHIVFDNG